MIEIDCLVGVEDEPSNRLVLRLLVEKMLRTRYCVILENSVDFMRRVHDLPARPGIFLLDIHVSPFNGFQMLKMIREDPIHFNAKVVALTASVTNEEVERLREGGFDGAIGKPITLCSFPIAIERIMKGERVWQV